MPHLIGVLTCFSGAATWGGRSAGYGVFCVTFCGGKGPSLRPLLTSSRPSTSCRIDFAVEDALPRLVQWGLVKVGGGAGLLHCRWGVWGPEAEDLKAWQCLACMQQTLRNERTAALATDFADSAPP